MNRGGYEQAVTQRGGVGEDKKNLDSRGSRAEHALVYKHYCERNRK